MFGENNWIFRPVIVGGIIVAYEYFNNRGQPMMTHFKVSALGAGASLASGYIGNMLPLPDFVEAMGTPLLTGTTFSLGRKFVLGSRNGFIMDGLEVIFSLLINPKKQASFNPFIDIWWANSGFNKNKRGLMYLYIFF